MSDFRLQVFVKVAKRLNLTQAAQELGISQPAVSKNIQELELQYNTQLLNRSNNKISLTPAGKLFHIHAEKILDHYGALEAEMYRISDNYCGEIRISADTPIVDSRMFEMFLAFCKQHPCIKVTFKEGYAKSVKSSLLEEKLDIAFTNGPITDNEVIYTPFAEQKWVFVAYARGIFAEKTQVTIDEITDYKLNINVFKSEATYDYNILLQNNKYITHFSDLELIKSLIFKNDSVGLLPLFAVEQEVMAGKLKVIDLDGVTFQEEVGIVSRPNETNHAVQWFLDFAHEYNL